MRSGRSAGGSDASSGAGRGHGAVWELAVEAQGKRVRADLRIPFPYPLVIRGGSKVPAGLELVGMFAYRLVSGHWKVQTGVARIGEEGTVTRAGIIAVAAVTGREKRRAKWMYVAWLAMRVHVRRMRSEGGGVLTSLASRGRRTPPSPAPPPGSGYPPPPSRHRSARLQGPAYKHPRGGMWLNGWRSSSSSTRRGRSARSTHRPRGPIWRRALLRRTKTGGPLRWSAKPFAATRSASLPR